MTAQQVSRGSCHDSDPCLNTVLSFTSFSQIVSTTRTTPLEPQILAIPSWKHVVKPHLWEQLLLLRCRGIGGGCTCRIDVKIIFLFLLLFSRISCAS